MKKVTTSKRGIARSKPVRIFTDGAGARPDGKGSGFAWIREDTGEKYIHHEDGLTNNRAEYRAVLALVEALPKASAAEVLTDSDLVANQFNKRYKVLDPMLAELLAKIRKVIDGKRLEVTVSWVPRQANLAGKLL
jgi:ribonuclease HI